MLIASEKKKTVASVHIVHLLILQKDERIQELLQERKSNQSADDITAVLEAVKSFFVDQQTQIDKKIQVSNIQ